MSAILPNQEIKKPLRIHPLMAAAAVAVIALSGTGIAAMTGLIGKPLAHTPPEALAALTVAAAPVLAAAPQVSEPASNATPVVEPAAPMAAESAIAPVAPAKPVATMRPKPAHVAAPARVAQPAPMAQAPAAYPAPPGPLAQAPAPAMSEPPPPPISRDWAVVDSVREVKTEGAPSAVGTVGGAVLGGVLGHQMGKGNGRDVGTVLGAIGGALGGRAIESQVRSVTRYDLTVRFEDGTTRTFSRNQPWGWSVGERVHLVNGQLAARTSAANPG